MYNSYEDIRNLTTQEPIWYDSNGVPRYCKFAPQDCPNIYADEVVYFKIACQSCNKKFYVEKNWSRFNSTPPLSIRLANTNTLHYGDPPVHSCIGDSMNCIDLIILEFWKWKREVLDLVRQPQFEIELKGGLSNE